MKIVQKENTKDLVNIQDIPFGIPFKFKENDQDIHFKILPFIIQGSKDNICFCVNLATGYEFEKKFDTKVIKINAEILIKD